MQQSLDRVDPDEYGINFFNHENIRESQTNVLVNREALYSAFIWYKQRIEPKKIISIP